MPRLARLDAPDVLHHIIIRGIERRNIFRDNFIDRLSDLLPAIQTACYDRDKNAGRTRMWDVHK